MSCIETFIPRTKLEHRLDREFGNNWKTRDTFLALLKSDGFKEWYRKNTGEEFSEDGDGRKTFPALRRYFNTKFFSVNDNTTIRNARGKFTSHTARQLAIDYCVGRLFTNYYHGSVEIDNNREIVDEEGKTVPNPNYGRTKIHHNPDKGSLIYELTNDIYYAAIDAFNAIISRNIQERVKDDFQTLVDIFDRNFSNENDEEVYNNIINKYKKEANEKGIVIFDAYDLAAVFSTNDKITSTLRDRYVKVLADNSARYDYYDIMQKIMDDNNIATIQETNAFALYTEIPFGSVYQNEDGQWVYPDFLTRDVLSDSRLSFLNKFKSLEDEFIEQENKEMNPEATTGEEVEEAKVDAENDDTIQAANSHLGVYDSFMKHADSIVRAYLSSLPNLNSLSIKYVLPDGSPATEEDINDRTVEVIPVFDKDTSNELGVPTYMNLAEVMQVIYAYSDKSSANAMRASILRIAKDIPGMKGLYKIYEDTNPNNPYGYDLLFSLYTTFGKIAIAKSQVNTSSEGVDVKISNERSLKVNALRMSMINSFRSTCLSIDDRTAKAELDSIKELIDKNDSTEENRTAIVSKIDKFLHDIFPDISEGTVFSYVYKNGEAGFKNSAKELILQIGAVVDKINNLNQEYNSLIIAQQDIYRQIRIIQNGLLNNKYDRNEEKAQIEKIRELKRQLTSLYRKDYTSGSQSAVYNLANILVDYTLVRTEQNSSNIHGDMSSDVINNNMITNLTNLLQNNEALKQYGDYKFLSQQYDFSNIMMESTDENGNIINFGLFRRVEFEEVDEETGEITVNSRIEPTSYANQLLSFQLFDGVRNVDTGSATLYAEMTRSDYIVTAINEFFNHGTINDGEIQLANYFTRIPSDATKTFVMRAPKYSIKGIGINGRFNRNHPIFQQFRNVVKQEIQDAVTAASKFFVIDANGYVNIDENNPVAPKFKEGWSNEGKDTKRAFDQYHTKNDENRVPRILEPIKDNGVIVGYKLVGNVFHSDRFVISTTQENFGDRLFGNGVDDGIINILYGRDKNGVVITEENGKVVYSLTNEQEEAIDNLIEDFIKAYIKDFEERIDNVKQYIPEQYRTRENISEFALNTFLTYINYNDILEGDTKFYKNSQDFLKRAKEMQGSGVPYGIVDYNKFVPDLTPIASRLDIADIFIPNENDKGDGKVVLRNGFTAVTIKNTIRTSEEAKRLFGYYDKNKKFIPGSLVNRKHNGKSIINEETAERLLGLYSDTKTNDAQSYITLDEWIRRITARGQFARYESLIRKLVDPNAELTPEDIDEFVQVQKNFYYDQHYNSELGVVAPRQIKNAEFVLIPRFLTYTTDEVGEDGLLKKVVHNTELMTVYNLMRKYKIDQLNTAETSKAGKANVLTLWNEDGVLTDETIAQFEEDLTNAKITDNQAIEKFSYNNLYLQQDVPQHMDTENKAGIQIMKKILDNIPEEYDKDNNPIGLYAKKVELMDCYCKNIEESFNKLMKELDIPVDENGYPELEWVEGPNRRGSWRIKGLSYEKLFERLKEEANRTGVNSNVAEFFELDRNGEPLMRPFLGNVSSKLESIIQSIFNNNITRQKLPGFHAAQVTGIGIAGKWTIKKGEKDKTIKTSNDLRYHPIDKNGKIAAYAEVIIPKPKELQHLSDEEALYIMQQSGADMFIGYRIPTEGKQSISVMKVVGFLDKSQGSTIIVPDDWVSQTGADFDIDSIYAICPSFYQDKNTGKWRINYDKNTRTGRNNTIVKNMIDILSDPKSIEENLSCSNFKDIISARERILKGTETAKRKASRSAYNFIDQADYQEDAISGTRLKGMSVTRDTLCSVCNTVRPTINKTITVEYSEYDKEKNPTGVKYEDLVEAYDKVQIINHPDKTRTFVVEHTKFGWSKNNRNVKGRLITAYSSQTTAHILDAVKEGNIPNVNEFTFGIYKLFPDLGADYDTAVSFMMLPGVSRIVNKYNASRSVYSDSLNKQDVDKLVLECVKEIAIELGLISDIYVSYPDVLKALENYARAYLNSTGRNNFSFEHINKTIGTVAFNGDRQIETIKKGVQKVDETTPVEEYSSLNFITSPSSAEFYSGAAIGSDTEWGTQARRLGIKVKDYTTSDYRTLSPEKKNEVEEEYDAARRFLGKPSIRIYNVNNPNDGGVLTRRDMLQADSADAIFAIAERIVKPGEEEISNGKSYTNNTSHDNVQGGTANAVARGIIRGIPVFVFDQSENTWKVWNYKSNSFVKCSEPKLTAHAATIGTRKINSSGKNAISSILRKSLDGRIENTITFENNNINITKDVKFDSDKVEEILSILQFQYLAGIAQGIGDYARVLNPDKFGAKVSTFATRKALNDINKILQNDKKLLSVRTKVSDKEVLDYIDKENKAREEYNKRFEQNQENNDIAEAKEVMSSDKTILSNDELDYWNAQGVTGKPRILVASEHSDPAFYSNRLIKIINGEESFKDYFGNEVTGEDFNGLYIVTKHDGLPIKRLLETDIPKLIHFSITSLGGTPYEPGVMKYNDLLDRIKDLIAQGLDPNCVTIRVDPIIPGVTNFDDVENIVRRASEMGIRRIRFSVMDNYPENKIKGTKSTEEYLSKLGYDFSKYYDLSPTDISAKGNNGTSKYKKFAKQEVIDEIAKKMLEITDKYGCNLSTCAEVTNVSGISKEGCLSVDQVNDMLGTDVEDRGVENNNYRKLCSCFGGKTDVLAYDAKCASMCGYCYAGHNVDSYYRYYDKDGKLLDGVLTRTREKRKLLKVDTKTKENVRRKLSEKVDILEGIYPDISKSRYSVKDYISSTGVSSYPSLNNFLKYATLTSIFVEEQVFETERDDFRETINTLGGYLGRALTEDEYNKFKSYYLSQRTYLHTAFQKVITDARGNAKLTDPKDVETIANDDSYERITGINMPIKFELVVNDVTNPTPEEKEAFMKLTPAQKVLWIKQNAAEVGIFKYLNVNLRNANQATNFSSTHQITFNAAAVDEEFALAEMRKAWNNRNWFVKETVRDLFKYAIVVENYRMSRRGITRILVNDVLRDTGFNDKVGENLSYEYNPGQNIYINYIRGHAKELNILTFTNRPGAEIILDSSKYDTVTFDMTDNKNTLYKLKVIANGRNKKEIKFPNFIIVVDILGNETLCRLEQTGDEYITLYPLNKLMPNENNKFSVNESFNEYASNDFYEKYVTYLDAKIRQMEGVSDDFYLKVEDYKFKSNKVNQVEDVNLDELADTNNSVRYLINTITQNKETIAKQGMYVRSPLLAKKRPSTETGSPNSYITQVIDGKEYIIKHIDTNANRSQDRSINGYIAAAFGDIADLRDQGYNVDLDAYAERYVSKVLLDTDRDIADIVKQAIKSGLRQIDDVFFVIPRKTITMEQSIEEIVPEGVVGMRNRRNIGDDNAADVMYKMSQSGIDIENTDNLKTNSLPVIKYIAEYTKLAVDSYKRQFKEFWRDTDGVFHSVDDDNIVAHIASDDEELARYTALIGDVKSFISQMSFITKNNISIEEQPESFREAIRSIIESINSLEGDETFKKMSTKLLDYLKSQSDDDLLISQLYELTDGYQNIGKIESLVTDAQEAPIPLMQIILHIATRNVRGEDMRHFKNAKKFRRKVEELTRQAKDAGLTVDLNKIIDEQGRLIQPYNRKFVDDYRKFRKELDDIAKDPDKGINSLEYLKKKHEFDIWKYHNLHQRYIDGYYKDVLDNEELILNDAHGFPRVYARYKKLDARRREILSNSPDGELTKTQEDELLAITNEINDMISTYDKPHIYEVVDTSITRAEYTDADRAAEDDSYEAAEALNRYIDRSAEIRMKYFNKNVKDGFEEALKKHLKIKFDSEAPDVNGNKTTPDSILENSPAFEEYRRSMRWLKYNARLVLTPEFSKIINKAYKLLGVGSFGRNFDVLNLIKTKGAKDDDGIVNGELFTDEELEFIRKKQEEDYNYDAVSGYAPERLITNGNGSPFVWRTAFWEQLKADGVTNNDYIGAVFELNEILKLCYNSRTKEVDTTKLTKEQLKELGRLYGHLRTLHKTRDGSRERAQEISEFIINNTEQEPLVNPVTGVSRFEEEKAKALALWGEDSEMYKIWEEANTQLVVTFDAATGITLTERKPNIFLYTTIKPKGAVGTLVFDENGIPTGCDGNSAFKGWIDEDKTVATNILGKFVSKIPTKYYYARKSKVYERQLKADGTYESDEERQARINEWTKKNHVYNPYTHSLEPLQCWLRYEYTGTNLSLASYTGESGDDTFQIYHYEPRFSQTETEPKAGVTNDNFVEGGYLNNFKEYSSSNPLGDKAYKNNKYKKLNRYEKKVREEFDGTLKAYAKSSAARAYIRDGSLPAFHKHTESHSAAWHAKQILKGFGWYYQAQGSGPFRETVDYEHDFEPVTPGLKELMDKRSKEFEPQKLPKRSEFPAGEAGDREYQKKLDKVRKENQKRAEERAKISQEIMNRNWLEVMERFIVEAGHHNSVQMNKNLIYFGLDYLRNNTVNLARIGKDEYKVDRRASLGNNENYEQEAYGKDTLEVYEAFARRFIFNEYKKDQGWLTTVGNLAQQLSSAKYMMINVTGGISNVTYGESQIAMEAFANEYFNAKEWAVGKKLWMNSIVSFGAHLYDDTATDIGDALCKMFNTLEFDSITELHEDNPGAAVKWQRVRNSAYVLQTLGEHFMQNGALLTMLSSHRLVSEVDRGTGKPRYYAWSLARYIRNEREKALKSVLTSKEKREFDKFISTIKDNPNETKDYAWRRRDVITEYAIRNLSKDRIEQFNAKRKELEKNAEKKFYSLPTLFDQFELKDGYAEFREGRISDGIILSNLDEKDAYRILGEMKNKVISVNKKIHGVYDRLGASRLEQEWYGGIVMQYHKHIWPGIMKRYRRHGYFNEDRGTVDKGAYVSLFDFLSIPFRNEVGLSKETKDAMTGLQNFFKQATNFLFNIRMYYDVLPEYDRANIRRCIVEIGEFFSAVAIATALRLAGDDEKEKDGIPYNLAVLISDRFLSEVQMYTPTGLVGEAKKQWSSPVAAWTSVTDMLKLMNELAKIILEGDEYEPTYATGPNAGKSKVNTLILRNIPIVRSWNALWRLPKNNKYYKLQSNDLFVDIAYNALHSDTDD